MRRRLVPRLAFMRGCPLVPHYWVFVGWLPGDRPLPGRPGHIDSISESDGAWQLQIHGTKLWQLRPAEECHARCGNATTEVVLRPGQYFSLDTNRWYHQTTLLPRTDSRADASESVAETTHHTAAHTTTAARGTTPHGTTRGGTTPLILSVGGDFRIPGSGTEPRHVRLMRTWVAVNGPLAPFARVDVQPADGRISEAELTAAFVHAVEATRARGGEVDTDDVTADRSVRVTTMPDGRAASEATTTDTDEEARWLQQAATEMTEAAMLTAGVAARGAHDIAENWELSEAEYVQLSHDAARAPPDGALTVRIQQVDLEHRLGVCFGPSGRCAGRT